MSYVPGSRGSPIERFERKFIPVPEAGCWIWEGAAGRYGCFSLAGKRPTEAHRASWILYRGEIPAGLRVLHRCDVPLCVNPSHLFLGTAKDNTHDMLSKGRHRFGVRSGKDHWRNIRRIGSETV